MIVTTHELADALAVLGIDTSHQVYVGNGKTAYAGIWTDGSMATIRLQRLETSPRLRLISRYIATDALVTLRPVVAAAQDGGGESDGGAE